MSLKIRCRRKRLLTCPRETFIAPKVIKVQVLPIFATQTYKMKHGIKAYFSFTRKERVGIIVLMGVILSLLAVRIGMHVWMKPDNDAAQQEKVAKAWENYKQIHSVKTQPEAADNKYAGGVVNINTADSATLSTLKGIGPVNASRILSFRRNYGVITDMEQIKAICTMPSATFNELKQHISLSGEGE